MGKRGQERADHLAALAMLIVDAPADVSGIVLRDEPFSPHMVVDAVGWRLRTCGQ